MKEYSEKGISGNKVSAEDRDALQELKDATIVNEIWFVVNQTRRQSTE